jgi:hypothetical protein
MMTAICIPTTKSMILHVGYDNTAGTRYHRKNYRTLKGQLK